MTKVLAYCAFLHREGLKLTPCGVNNATMRVLSHGNLRLLWSYVEWPFRDSAIQRNAVEFHGAVSHMFAQGAVLPFRLLSVFDDEQAIIEFVEARKADFVADLERLRNLVQMECVIYFAPQAATGLSGKDYLERKAEVLRGAEGYAERIRNVLSGISRAVRTRESKNGLRIFVLVERGQEHSFRSKVRDLPLPERLARRISGPWPPSEFLSDALKMPQMTGKT
ncbi:MAG TPA: GvpL/GvpF family gas vesicle protein [Candidatus Angelobacter sp.]